MDTVNIGEALGTGWKKFTERGWYLFGFTLAIFVLVVATSAGNALFTALMYLVYGGYLAVMLRHYRGEKISFDSMFENLDSRWVSFAFAGIVKTLLIMVGFVFFIVPGVYLAIRWMFVELLVIDEGLRPMEALKRSAEMTDGHRWKLFFFTLLMVLIGLVSMFALVVGIAVAGAVFTLAIIKVYSDLKQG